RRGRGNTERAVSASTLEKEGRGPQAVLNLRSAGRMSFLFSLLCFKAFSWRFLLSGIFFWFFLVERGIIHDGQREIMGYTEGFCVCMNFYSDPSIFFFGLASLIAMLNSFCKDAKITKLGLISVLRFPCAPFPFPF
ncbi:hypothetical protein PSV09DRAFT_2310318, partial [Bipolaris maydis]